MTVDLYVTLVLFIVGITGVLNRSGRRFAAGLLISVALVQDR